MYYSLDIFFITAISPYGSTNTKNSYVITTIGQRGITKCISVTVVAMFDTEVYCVAGAAK
jgi:hypothetical protein